MNKSFLRSFRLAKLWDFSLTTAEFAYKLDKAINVKRFTGSIVIEGVPVHVETILIVKMFRVGLAVGFSFDGESYGKLAKKLSGIGIGFLDKIGLQLEVRALLRLKVGITSDEKYIPIIIIIIIIIIIMMMMMMMMMMMIIIIIIVTGIINILITVTTLLR